MPGRNHEDCERQYDINLKIPIKEEMKNPPVRLESNICRDISEFAVLSQSTGSISNALLKAKASTIKLETIDEKGEFKTSNKKDLLGKDLGSQYPLQNHISCISTNECM